MRSALLNVQSAHTRQALPLNSKSARTRSKSCRATPPTAPLVGPLTKCFCYFDCCLKRLDRPGLVISSHSFVEQRISKPGDHPKKFAGLLDVLLVGQFARGM